ncbi:hypothetical protein D043_3285B, partial [Vibrio parahaemolyticus EKP-021]
HRVSTPLRLTSHLKTSKRNLFFF